MTTPGTPGSSREPEPDDHVWTQLAIGMATGLGLGVVTGFSTGDLVVWLPLGAGAGIAFGLVLGNRDDGHGRSRHGRRHPRPGDDR